MSGSFLARFLLLCMILLWLGCSPEDSAKTFAISGTSQTLFSVDESGGSFCEASGLCLHFPSGAVAGATELVGRLTQSAPAGAVGALYEFSLKQGKLLKEIRLVFPVPEGKQQTDLVLVSQKGSDWESVPTTVLSDGKKREGTTDHLSLWTLAPESTCEKGKCLLSKTTCTKGLNVCGGFCVDFRSDARHCGACDKACPTGEACSQGKCEKTLSCGVGFTPCGDECVNLSTSKEHCGSCRRPCKDGNVCVQGGCQKPNNCKAGLFPCDGDCVELQTDVKHCGNCGFACADKEVCEEGVCRRCPAGKTLCSGVCVNLQTSVIHCGNCDFKCAAGEICERGGCQSSTPCPSGQTRCSGDCVVLKSDRKHCGVCDKACKEEEICKNGGCEKAPPCPSGQTRCGNDCVDFQTNAAHCGACDKACKTGETCVKGVCEPPMKAQVCYTMLCSGDCVDHEYDEKNCGACGVACKSGEVCCKGKCIAEDDQNCGGCGYSCLSFQTCKSGKCERRADLCVGGQTLCSINGKELRCVDLQTNAAHCGQCGNICPNDTACVNGACSGSLYPPCQTGGAPCKGECQSMTCASCTSGTQLSCGGKCTDINGTNGNANCGGCGFVCPKGTTCDAQGRCSITPQKTTTQLCDGVSVSFAGTDATNAHCGTCGKRCGPRVQCGLATAPNATPCECGDDLLCDGRCWNLTDKAGAPTNPNHCGACGTICPQGNRCKMDGGTMKCAQGSPNPGWTWCNKRWVMLDRDAVNCGSCGNMCPSGKRCDGGVCL